MYNYLFSLILKNTKCVQFSFTEKVCEDLSKYNSDLTPISVAGRSNALVYTGSIRGTAGSKRDVA